MANSTDPISEIAELDLDDPENYTTHRAEQWVRWSPNEADTHATDETGDYRRFVDASCDLTMRGGTTSGVIYPLAVCSLARRYVFRSVGGASAGAIAASATAAAEYGRFAEQPDTVPEGSVRPGFAGLAGLIRWMVSGTGAQRWRLVQLFQPNTALSRIYRVLVALMQSPQTTGRNRLTCVVAALLTAVSRIAGVVLTLLFLGWLTAPFAMAMAAPPAGWNDARPLVAGLAAVAAVAAAGWLLRVAAGWFRLGSLVLAVPLAAGVLTLLLRGTIAGGPANAAGWMAATAAVVTCWLVTTLAVGAAFAVIYGRACRPVLAEAERFRFGIVPGATPYRPTPVDRLAGVPASTGVPPLATWLADRLDELAGLDGERALTFGDLWRGPDAGRDGERDPAVLRNLATHSGDRVINLALMTTDLSAGRPFRLPLAAWDGVGDRWQFCPDCLDGIVGERVIRQMSTEGTANDRCPRHPERVLHWLPDPWDMPVVLAVRMSLSLPGLICPVPLHRLGRVHWFSDGGITSNFPIHFFDALLPRWPTFGLNLHSVAGKVDAVDEVFLPPQSSAEPAPPWSAVGAGAADFAGRILNTFLGWRDTMQSALPGFRGRIAHVRQGDGEGGTNLFMPPELIAELALRGYRAGEQLKVRFSIAGTDGEAPGFTQTDRYRWLRMRLALREYREISLQAAARAPLYRERATKYPIPEALAGWFADAAGGWPRQEPHGPAIEKTFDGLGELADSHLSEPFDGTAPVNPVLRLTPPE
ncbi:Patatin-like phospholipase [Amycolatopsis marina]|uniref:Patatin-like phospholipase n=1 Tax=Amycolatopsis marina TaxID=490629 RepID=A0A1I0WZS9_9PSEU|nr:patatin-like phospholipase family protein [Amycolatopsis marina]SFA93638.1 Patatin-like phospholipase [Amycolatopsis marina]